MTSLPSVDYSFRNPEVLKQALTHKSFHNENASASSGHNEKLEFLGDSVLDLALSAILMKKYPELDEGALSKIRASLVNENFLAEMAKSIELDKHMYLGRGEEKMLGAGKPRLQASCFEAVIGALYMDGGLEPAYAWIEKLFTDKLENINLNDFFATDYKTILQEKIQKIYKVTPEYKLLKHEGPDHDKVFHSEIVVEENVSFTGVGRTKKASEQDAAKKALESMNGK